MDNMAATMTETQSEMGQNGVPLYCIICIRKPNFSDISHLLTHISSKQHLSNYFKTKVKAVSNATAKDSLEKFDEWYEAWSIDDLLRERMQQKEKKKRSTATRTAKPEGKAQKTASTDTSLRNVESKIQQDLADEVTRDYNHAPTIKIESALRPSFMKTCLPYEQSFLSPVHAAQLEANHLQPYYVKREFSTQPDIDQDDLISPSRYGTRPMVIRHQGSESLHETASSSIRSSAYIDDLKDDETSQVKLKGIIWPGMDLFDSATPEMQRRRNQKKTFDVVTQLAAASIRITPDEVIFDKNGVFLQQREINGNPDHDFHLTGETTPEPDTPQKRGKGRAKANRKARPLAELDVNQPKKRPYVRRKMNNTDQAALAKAKVDTERLDNPISYGAKAKRKRTGFSIHRDNTGPDITFNQPAPMTYLTSGLGHTHEQHHDAGRSQPPARGLHGVSSASFLLEQHIEHDSKPDLEEMNGEARGALPGRDLSAFGHLTNIYNPGNSFGMFNLHNVGFVSQPSMTDPLQYQLQHDRRDSVRALNQTYHTWPASGMMHYDVPQAQYGVDLALGSFDARQHALNPLFFGSDQIFEDEESDAGEETMKREVDHASNADTISLASDQK